MKCFTDFSARAGDLWERFGWKKKKEFFLRLVFARARARENFNFFRSYARENDKVCVKARRVYFGEIFQVENQRRGGRETEREG